MTSPNEELRQLTVFRADLAAYIAAGSAPRQPAGSRGAAKNSLLERYVRLEPLINSVGRAEGSTLSRGVVTGDAVFDAINEPSPHGSHQISELALRHVDLVIEGARDRAAAEARRRADKWQGSALNPRRWIRVLRDRATKAYQWAAKSRLRKAVTTILVGAIGAGAIAFAKALVESWFAQPKP